MHVSQSTTMHDEQPVQLPLLLLASQCVPWYMADAQFVSPLPMKFSARHWKGSLRPVMSLRMELITRRRNSSFCNAVAVPLNQVVVHS